MRNHPQRGPGFLEENARWVWPLVGACFFAIVPKLAYIFGLSWPLPFWVRVALSLVAIAGMLSAFIVAIRMDTLGAKIFRRIGGALLLGTLAYQLIKLV